MPVIVGVTGSTAEYGYSWLFSLASHIAPSGTMKISFCAIPWGRGESLQALLLAERPQAINDCQEEN